MAEILLVNPRRRKRRKSRARRRKHRKVSRRRRRNVAVNPRRRRRRRRNPKYRRVSRRRRNPVSLRGFGGKIMPTVKKGVIGAGGGLLLDLLLGYTKDKLPEQLQTGYGLTATKVIGAVLVGIVGNMALRGKGGDLAVGAMTVVLHDELKALAIAQFPELPLGEYITYAPAIGYSGADALLEPSSVGVGEYMSGMGEYPADSADTPVPYY